MLMRLISTSLTHPVEL